MVELVSQMPDTAFAASMTDHILLLNSHGDANGLREGLRAVAQIDPAWSLQLGMECIRSVEDTLARKQISETWRARFKATGEAALETMREVFPRDSTQDLSPVVAFMSERAKESGRAATPAPQPPVTVLRHILPAFGAQSFQGPKSAFVTHLS